MDSEHIFNDNHATPLDTREQQFPGLAGARERAAPGDAAANIIV